ncbi:hypothetical protein MHYP_G00299260 [Metynnis hypsauchen]
MLKRQHAEIAPPLQGDKECWYLPLFGVYHPKKPEKIRIVFDSSAAYDGVSLNDVLITGPDLNNNLVGLLMRKLELESGCIRLVKASAEPALGKACNEAELLKGHSLIPTHPHPLIRCLGYRSDTYSCYLEQAIHAPEKTTKYTSHVIDAHTFLIAHLMRVRRALLGRKASLLVLRRLQRLTLHFFLREAPRAL